MEKETKINLYSVILVVLFYLIFISIPFSMFIDNEELVFWLQIGLRVLYIPFFFYYTRKERLSSLKVPRFKVKDAIFMPFILITSTNLLVVLISGFGKLDLSNAYILKYLLFYALVAFDEELVFRVVVNTELLKYHSRLKSIIISSAIFGLIHLVNINSLGSIPYVLLQVLYSFGFGLVLALIYTYTDNLIYIFVLHFLFDFINGFLAVELFDFDYNLWFYLVNIIISILFVLYGFFVYKHKEKEVMDASKNMDI